ncbi:hypothetical protein Goshw_017505 [Gossypium schwendimanii]|nr:hypothetical protein [Gossypium schwendimanii]
MYEGLYQVSKCDNKFKCLNCLCITLK